ncbi:MAG TPA: myxococcus cysteine-rich repeat containing protein [Kofleriaceae bacterium]|nr:myxococcus cysteine-rich repeat containing protein [Kofleriaceae bacterium]
MNRSLLATSLLVSATLAGLSACTDPAEGLRGTIELNVVGQAPSGAVYRLRDATIVVAGPTSTTYWFTEDDPDRPALSADVVIGDYSATLQSGWRMERIDGPGPSTTIVSAELKSPNPTLFSVQDSQRTSVPLQFKVFGEEVDMSQGYDIVLEVEECTLHEAVCGDGVDNDCDGAVDCSDSDCTGAPGCAMCGNGTLEPGEACDDGNTASLDGCSSTCTVEPSEIEPNEDGTPSTGGSGITGNDFATANADANGAITGSTTLIAHIAPIGDEDVFAFENTGSASVGVRFDVWSSALGIGVPCGTSIDTVLVIRDATGATVASNDDRNGGADRCSALTVPLAPGRHLYAHFIEYGDNAAIPNYVIQVTYTPLCGNGVIDPGEQCDDGNAASGDGCSATCQIDFAQEIEPNGTFADAAASPLQIGGDLTIQGAIATPTDLDRYRLTVSAPTVVQLETFSSEFDCLPPTSLVVRLFDASGTQLTISAGASGCGQVVRFLAPGVYFVQVEENGTNASVPNYLLRASYLTDTGAESEPAATLGINDTIATASANLVGASDAYVFGDHTLDADVDVHAITVPPGARIRAEILEGDTETCESGGVDSLLILRDESGNTLATDDDDGRGFCSRIDGTGTLPLDAMARNATSTAQTYYLQVQASNLGIGQQRQFRYRLQISLY